MHGLHPGGGTLKALQAVAAAEAACARELPASVPSWGVQAQLGRLLDAWVAKQLAALEAWLARLLASETWQPMSSTSPSCARHAPLQLLASLTVSLGFYRWFERLSRQLSVGGSSVHMRLKCTPCLQSV